MSHRPVTAVATRGRVHDNTLLVFRRLTRSESPIALPASSLALEPGSTRTLIVSF